jgi:hypothetical protein
MFVTPYPPKIQVQSGRGRREIFPLTAGFFGFKTATKNAFWHPRNSILKKLPFLDVFFTSF